MPRLGYGQQALAPLLATQGIRTFVAPLYYLRDNPQLSLIPQRLGQVLDPCTQLRQLPWRDRAPRFRELAFGNAPDPYDPDRAQLSDGDLLTLALGPLDDQRSRGATLMLSTFHLAGATGTRGRDVELALAGLAVEHFRGQRMDDPPPFSTSGVRRELYATVAVRLGDLSSARARRELADAYLALGADGIWVKIAELNERSSRASIRAAGLFLGALREGRVPVACCGPGQLHLPLLAEGISASIGIAEGERFAAPRPKRHAAGAGKMRGRTRMAYNAALHRSFRVGSTEADEAFAAAACDCGEHQRTQSPKGAAVARHAALLRARQADEAMQGSHAQRRERLRAAATAAARRADALGLPAPHAVLECYEALFEGLDRAAVERSWRSSAL
jgi:hypothetical protein